MSASLGKPDRSPPPPFPCAMFSTRPRGLPTNIPLRDLSPSLGSTDSSEWKLLTDQVYSSNLSGKAVITFARREKRDRHSLLISFPDRAYTSKDIDVGFVD